MSSEPIVEKEKEKSINSVTPAEILKYLRDDIQQENMLIGTRMTWYVTSQAFLLTSFATSFTREFQLPAFFRIFIPLIGILISALIWFSLHSATCAQEWVLVQQKAFLIQIKGTSGVTELDRKCLAAYERTMFDRRTFARDKETGRHIHRFGRIAPLSLPLVFVFIWSFAYWAA